MYHLVLWYSQLPMQIQATANVLGMSGMIVIILDYVKVVMPDELEKIWLFPAAIGIGIGLAFIYHLDPVEGLQYGLSALGLATGRSMTKSAVVKARNGSNSAKEKVKL